MGSQLSRDEENDLKICEYFSGWTWDYVRNLTIKEKQKIVVYINKIARERKRANKNGRR